MPTQELLLVRVAAIAAVLALLWMARARPGTPRSRLCYALVALVGVAGFFDFGRYLRGQDYGFVDRWEQFHYQLGSKYYPELGYDGLYAASARAQASTAPGLPLPAYVRELRSFGLTPSAELSGQMEAVRGRFSEPRWQAFLEDHRDYVRHTSVRFWQRIYRDHGYNASPAWTAVARLFTGRAAASPRNLALLGLLDVLLFAGTAWLVAATFGARTACLFLALLGLGYGWRFNYTGTLLRLDWLAAVVAGICLVARGRPTGAGLCLGYAAMARVFPLLFLAGPAVLLARSLWEGRWPPWATRLGAGFALAVLALFLLGGTAGRGLGAWAEFAGQMQVYRAWSATSVGIDGLFVNHPGFLAEQPEGRRPLDAIAARLAEQRPLRLLASALLLAMLALAAWREDLAASLTLGPAAVFACSAPPGYYWILLCVVPLRGGLAASLVLLAIEAAAHLSAILLPGYENVPRRYGLLTWAYALFLFGWLLPAALASLRGGPRGEAGPGTLSGVGRPPREPGRERAAPA